MATRLPRQTPEQDDQQYHDSLIRAIEQELTRLGGNRAPEIDLSGYDVKITDTMDVEVTDDLDITEDMLNKCVRIGNRAKRIRISCVSSVGKDGDRIMFGIALGSTQLTDVNANTLGGGGFLQTLDWRDAKTVRKLSGQWYWTSEYDI